MTILIFAGGAGTRLWPLSRKASPKQFEPFFNGKSTLQLAIERVQSFGFENIYISTNKDYVELVQEQVPELDASHIFTEPAKRDLAAAIGLSLVRLKAQGVEGTVAMLWSDHLIERPELFVEALQRGEQLIQEDADRFVFLGEQPRFANQNLGWIHVGGEQEDGLRPFAGWKYRPEVSRCEAMFASGEWLWNPGYFVYDIDFVLELYRTHQPALLEAIEKMAPSESAIVEQYPKLEAMSFDNAIVEHVDTSQAVVIPVDMGWSDPGTLYAMKEALQTAPEEVVTHGLTAVEETQDAFVYNTVDEHVLAVVGLEGVVVVHTPDATLVCHKHAVPRIKTLLKQLEQEGLTKFL